MPGIPKEIVEYDRPPINPSPFPPAAVVIDQRLDVAAAEGNAENDDVDEACQAF